MQKVNKKIKRYLKITKDIHTSALKHTFQNLNISTEHHNHKFNNEPNNQS